MPTYYKPGTRRKNTGYVVRGRIEGRRYEIRTSARNKREAEAAWDRFKADVVASLSLEAGAKGTFRWVAERYAEAKGLSRANRAFLARIDTHPIAGMHVADITQLDIDQVAVELYPNATPATRIRQIYTPVAAVLHYAHDARLCPYIRVKRPRLDKPEPRRPQDNVRELLLANTKDQEHLLLTVLFFQGFRISEALALTWEHVSLQERTLMVRVGKARTFKVIYMHDRTFEALTGVSERTGRLFRWQTRDGVYKWLRPLTARLGVVFTPHMARHEFGARLNEEDVTNRGIMDAGTWTNERSVGHYTWSPARHVRGIVNKIK